MYEKMSEKSRLAALASITVLASVLRFMRLDGQSLWLDELLTIGSYTSPGGGISYGTKLLWDVHGPLYSLFMHFWSAVSSGEAWLRAPSAAAGVISVILAYVWLRRRAGEGTALTAALLLAVNPFSVYYSQELRFYSFLTMLVVLALIAFDRFDESPSFRSGLLLGISLGLACLAHFMALFLCAGLLLYMVVTGRLRGDRLRYGLLAAIVALVMVSPWIYRQLFFIRRLRAMDAARLPVVYRMEGSGPSAMMAYPYSLFAFAAGFSFGPDLRELHEISSLSAILGRYGAHIAAVALLFGAAGLAGLARLLREKRAALYISILAATFGAVTLAAALKIKVVNARYLMCAFPVFIAIVAHGIPRGKSRAAVAAGSLCALMLYSTWNYHFDEKYARDDIRGAVGIIRDGERPGDLILAPGIKPVIEHYYSGDRPVESLYAPFLDREMISERLDRMSEGRRRIWLVYSRPWDNDASGDIISLIGAGADREEEHVLPGVRLILFILDPAPR